ncbi:MAG TPA: SET domain-containing protein-lysine N-methyltransferase [Flavobacterium sp.]|nr:SET domain-containing protein-lysine N-methyltransferase [Flavobacterium sp.]
MKAQPYHVVRNSKIHGKGVFAKRPIRKGTKIIEYTGNVVSRKEADRIGTITENGHTHTMLFTIDDNRVIDGNTGGDARFINHSCDPNCEAVQYDDRIFIESLRAIPKGQELTYDYHLEVPGKITKKVMKEYECFCGSPNCRGTQIAKSILDKIEKKKAKKKAKKEKKRLKKEAKAREKAKKAGPKEKKEKAAKPDKKGKAKTGNNVVDQKPEKKGQKKKKKAKA